MFWHLYFQEPVSDKAATVFTWDKQVNNSSSDKRYFKLPTKSQTLFFACHENHRLTNLLACFWFSSFSFCNFILNLPRTLAHLVYHPLIPYFLVFLMQVRQYAPFENILSNLNIQYLHTVADLFLCLCLFVTFTNFMFKIISYYANYFLVANYLLLFFLLHLI